jgi:hypothetical protein
VRALYEQQAEDLVRRPREGGGEVYLARHGLRS